MFLNRIREWLRASSLRRMALLQGVVFGGTLLVYLLLARWSISVDLQATTKSIMTDDMMNYVKLYQKDGQNRLRLAASLGRANQHHIMRITEPEGVGVKVLFETSSKEVHPYTWEQLPPPWMKSGDIDWHVLQHPATKGELRVCRFQMDDGKTFWYGRTDADDRLYLDAVMRRLGFIAFVSLLAITVPIGWFALRVLGPLRRVTKSARVLAAGEQGAHLVAKGAIPEVVDLADAFNTCQDRISMLVLTSKERIADLSNELNSVNDQLAHELKTPLARVRGNIENLLDHYGEPEGHEAAARSLDEIDRTTDLIRNILTLRLADNGAVRLHLEVVLASAFLADIVETYAFVAEDRDLDFAVERESDGLVLLDSQRMRQAVTNLLDNAFAYTPRGGSVTVVQTVDEHGFTIRVQDSGEGLTDEDMRRIWQRFARGSVGLRDATGTGLGLPIVRAVAQAHFGDAGCFNRAEGGAEFWIWLPLAPEVIDPHESPAAKDAGDASPGAS
jgi:signal transduction histidine kinase